MKISVITPSYNQGRFISKCINSIKQQRGVDVEHIVLDNCSSDETTLILAQYARDSGSVKARILIEPDEGQAMAINKGFRMATGDILCWLNTDEFYHPGTLSEVAMYFSRNLDVDIFFGDCVFVDADGQIVKHKREYFFSRSMLVFYGCFMPSCATFVRRRIIDEGILLDDQFKVAMDFEWYVRLAQKGYRFGHIGRPLASFTWHDGNVSTTNLERRLLERRLVQDRYSGVPGPRFLRTLVYEIMRHYWIMVRVLIRTVNGG